MNENKHTPGPWIVNKSKYYCNGKPGIIWTSKGPGHGAICNMERTYPDSFNEANTRLIAAAPELLEALVALVSTIDGGDVLDSFTTQPAKATIAQAEKGCD